MKTPKKQSSAKASTIAGRLLREIQEMADSKAHMTYWIVDTKELKTLCASVLSQDETKGQRGKRKAT